MYSYAAANPLTEVMVLTGAFEPTNEGYALAKCAITHLCQYVNKCNSDCNYKTLIPCNLFGKYDKFGEKALMIPAILKKIDDTVTKNLSSVEIWDI